MRTRKSQWRIAGAVGIAVTALLLLSSVSLAAPQEMASAMQESDPASGPTQVAQRSAARPGSGISFSSLFKPQQAPGCSGTGSPAASASGSRGSGIGLPNPADVYCAELGYSLGSVREPEGVRSVCVFPDGSSCDSWQFFTGECGAAFSYCARQGYDQVTKTDGNNPFSPNYAVCVTDGREVGAATDLTGLTERFNKTLPLAPEMTPEPEGRITEGGPAAVAVPAAFSWRSKDGQNWMTAVGNQAACGSCWAFSAVGTTEAVYNITTGFPTLDLDLSEEFLNSDCPSPNPGSCCGGSHDAALGVIQNAGIPDEACMPWDVAYYQSGDCSCFPNPPCNAGCDGLPAACSHIACGGQCADWSSRLVTIGGYHSVANNQADIKQRIVDEGPLAVCLAMSGTFDAAGVYRCTTCWDLDGDNTCDSAAGTCTSGTCSSGGMIGQACNSDAECDEDKNNDGSCTQADCGTNHCVVMAGYDDATSSWLLKNSWGSGWNGNGYFQIGYGECHVEDYVYYVDPANLNDADLSITKSHSPEPVIAGQPLDYNLSVTNSGPDTALTVKVTDVLPSEVTFVATTGTCDTTALPTLTCDLGSLAAGETRSFTIKVTVKPDVVVNAGGPTTITNSASVSGFVNDANRSNNTARDVATVQDRADLRLFKDCKPDDPLLAGQTATCAVVVENLGPTIARDVQVVDTHLSAGTFTIGAVTSTAGSCLKSGGTVTCDLGDLNPGDRVTIMVPVTVSAPQNVNDRATASSGTPDPNPENNWDEDAVTFTDPVDLQVFKECKPDVPGTPLYAGTSGLCTIRVHNWGPATATGVKLTDLHMAEPGFFDLTLGGGVSCAYPPNPQATSATVTCDVGTLAVGAEAEVLVGLTSDEGMDVNDRAAAVADQADPNTANNTASDGLTFIAAADLALTKTATPSPVIAGTELTYDLSVTNHGPSTARNVVIRDVLPLGVSIVTVNAPDGSCANGIPGNAAAPTTCTFATLVKDVTKTMRVVVKVDPSYVGMLGNNAAVSADTFDPINSNNLAMASTSVVGSADLSVTKTDYPDPAIAGTLLTYDVKVLNAGPSNAVDVALLDVLPPEVAYQGYQVSNGTGTCSLLPGSTHGLSCDLNNLLPGEFVRVVFTVMVSPSTPHGATITNSATVSAATSDPDQSNNTATTDTTANASADLVIIKTASRDTSNPSPRITYSVRITNQGPSDALGAVVTDELPLDSKKVVYVFDTGNGACAYDSALHDVICNAGTVKAGEIWTVDIIVDARGSVRVMTNLVRVTSTTFDPFLANNWYRKDVRIKGGPGPQ